MKITSIHTKQEDLTKRMDELWGEEKLFGGGICYKYYSLKIEGKKSWFLRTLEKFRNHF